MIAATNLQAALAIGLLVALATAAAGAPTGQLQAAHQNDLMQPTLRMYSPTIKRARKISGFMPMRGRKDGRDSRLALANFAAGAADRTGNGDELFLGAREREFDAESPIAFLADTEDAGTGKLWVPAQFASQMQFRQTNSAVDEAGGAGGNQPRALLMDAKPRRAFQPMRGKRPSESEYGSDGGASFD